MLEISGVFSFDRQPVSKRIIDKISMSKDQTSCGPKGCFHDELVALRLNEPSPGLSQANSNELCFSHDGNIVIALNGRIDNGSDLRNQLGRRGRGFATHTDAEIVLRAFEAWGCDFVSRLNGLFAIAIYDKVANTLYLYRDRAGGKQLYMAGRPADGRVWFASDIKSILANGHDYRPQTGSIAQYLALGYIAQPATAFAGINHLPPAHMAIISIDGVDVRKYWDLSDIRPDPHMTRAQAKAGLISLLDDATRLRMPSNSACGAVLSGDLDGSSVVGIMTQHTAKPLRTFHFNLGIEQTEDAEYARMTARRFGTLHVSERLTGAFTKSWTDYIFKCAQPNAAPSFMLMEHISRLVARELNTVLADIGCGELFAVSNSYQDLLEGGGVGHLAAGWQARLARQSGPLQDVQIDELLKGELRDAFLDGDPYRALTSELGRADHQDPINRVLLAQTKVALPLNDLVKLDPMAMANSLDVRAPFLDHRVMEFAFSVPGAMKLANGEEKSVFGQALEPLLGRQLAYRKRALKTPTNEFLCPDMTGYIREILLDGRLASRGLTQMDKVEQMVGEFEAGAAGLLKPLSALGSLEIWFRLFVDKDQSQLL